VQAFVSINRDFEKLPLNRVKFLIGLKWRGSYELLRISIPEISEDDFVLQVQRLDWDPLQKNQLYAECKHGVITFQ
jgi:hypothetical protein